MILAVYLTGTLYCHLFSKSKNGIFRTIIQLQKKKVIHCKRAKFGKFLNPELSWSYILEIDVKSDRRI